MKRLLLDASVSALGVAACGSSHGSAPERAASHPQREAGRTATGLLARMIMPSGAHRISERTGNSVVSSVNFGVNIFTQYEYRHAFWQVPEPLDSVVAFLKRHPPPNFRLGGAGNAETYPHEGVWFDGRSEGGHIPSRLLVSLVPFEVGTAIRVDAGVAWTHPRPAREAVPAGVREIDVRSSALQPALRRARARRVTRRVTSPREITRIVDWFDALNVVQPRTFVAGCALVLYVPVKFVFRSASGAVLADAIVPSVAASSCEQIQFRIRGRPQTPLIDSTPVGGMAFIERVQRLLGVRFGPRRPGL